MLYCPGDAMRIRPQSAPSKKPDAGHIDRHLLKGDNTPAHVREEIRRQREALEERQQAERAHAEPHPPQTKFIYKRPVAGKIKLKMEIRGKSPTPAKPEADKEKMSEEEKERQARLSYDDWVKRKRELHEDMKKKKAAERQRELAKSDPELERLIPELGKKRVQDKLNMRKRIDTGIKSFDEKTNSSFGGGDFNGEAIERPRSAYRLESDRTDPDQPALSVKQIQRPSTAPSKGRAPPSPKRSAKSPRKAIIPQRVDKVMENENKSNPYVIEGVDRFSPHTLPFSGEKGIPKHLVERQRRIFADIVTNNLDEIEQRALLTAELIKEGVSDEDIEKYRQEMDEELARFDARNKTGGQGRDEEAAGDVHEEASVENKGKAPKITDVMYSPRPKSDDSSDSSSDEGGKDTSQNTVDQELKTEETPKEPTKDAEHLTPTESMTNVDNRGNADESDQVTAHSHYKTYDNLNELQIDSPRNEQAEKDEELRRDIEQLKDRVAHLHLEQLTGLHSDHTHSLEPEHYHVEENVTIVADVDPNVVGILKESKRDDSFVLKPEPHDSADFEQSNSANDTNESGSSPREDLNSSMRKRVSFNEHPEVFQSFESTSTDTVTPDQEEFDAQAESLDAQTYADHFDNEPKPCGQQQAAELGSGQQTEDGASQQPDPGRGQEQADDTIGDQPTETEDSNSNTNNTTFITNPEENASD